MGRFFQHLVIIIIIFAVVDVVVFGRIVEYVALTSHKHELKRIFKASFLVGSCHFFDKITAKFFLLIAQLVHIDVKSIVEILLFHFVLRYERSSMLLHALKITPVRHLYVCLIVLLAVVVCPSSELVFRHFAAVRKLGVSLTEEPMVILQITLLARHIIDAHAAYL